MSTPSANSYRDPHSNVTFEGDTVVRRFSPEGEAWFLAARDAGLIDDLTSRGLLVDHEVTGEHPLVITSRRLPMVTYPYEWTASMLRDAGLVTLEIARRAWDAGFHLRDASAFNLVFSGGRPVLVDLGSFRPGHTPFFLAYGQFCDHFLNPLVLADATGVSHRLGWHGLEGLSASMVRSLLGMRALKPRYIRHVWARAKLDSSSKHMAKVERQELRENYGLAPDAVRRTFDQLTDLLGRLEHGSDGVWRAYEAQHGYSDTERSAKEAFVAEVAQRTSGEKAIDIGANVGRFAEILAPRFKTVVAVESDEAALDHLYVQMSQSNVVPMLVDIADPSAARGWAGLERSSALERLRGADLVVWLAVLHHLVIGRNVPLALIFELASTLSSHHVFEYVDPADEMAQLLMASRPEAPWSFDQSTFERAALVHFGILQSVQVSPTRTLYEMARKRSASSDHGDEMHEDGVSSGRK